MHCQIVQQFEAFFMAHLPEAKSFHPSYNDALKYMLKAGGKRFRPYLLLTLVKNYAPLLLQNAFYVASGLEMLHTYSLIHDDLPIMDNANLRRGKTTLHVKYDEVTALLVGDALNTHAFYMLSQAPLNSDVKVRLVASLSKNAGVGGMVLGQALDCAFEEKKISFEELKTLHVNKTAKLIASSLEMGGIIAGLSEDEISKWYDFGLELGLLFQIQDDIIDITQDESEAGKTTSNDEDKNTYVSILGLQEAKVQKDELLKTLHVKLSNINNPLQNEFKNMLDRYFKER